MPFLLFIKCRPCGAISCCYNDAALEAVRCYQVWIATGGAEVWKVRTH